MKGVRRSSAAREIAYIALTVAFVTVCAQIQIPVGVIPVTLQTFAVCLMGALLGWKRSLAALFIYIFMGFIGIPVFAGFKAGYAALFGPTGGYIFGFLFAALLPALAKYIKTKNKWVRVGLFYCSMLLGISVCYFFGTVWFVVSYRCSVGYALTLCALPFLLPDAVKLFCAAVLSVRLERYIK